MAQQLGFAAKSVSNDSGRHVDISGNGVPADGLDTKIVTSFAGLGVEASGKLAIKAEFEPSFTGTFSATADDLAPAIATTGAFYSVRRQDHSGRPTGAIATTGPEATLTRRDGAIAGSAPSVERSSRRVCRMNMAGSMAIFRSMRLISAAGGVNPRVRPGAHRAT